MVEKLNRRRTGRYVRRGFNLQPLLDRLLAHRLVRAERDHHVERGSRPADLVVDSLEHRADRRGARAVGDDQQHLAVAESRPPASPWPRPSRACSAVSSLPSETFLETTPTARQMVVLSEPAIDDDVGAGDEARRLFAGEINGRAGQLAGVARSGPSACGRRSPWRGRSVSRPR